MNDQVELSSTELRPTEIERYSRQLIIHGWSSGLQLRLRRMSAEVRADHPVLIRYLAALGVGRIQITGTNELYPDLAASTADLNPDIIICEDAADFPTSETICRIGPWNFERQGGENALLIRSADGKTKTVTLPRLIHVEANFTLGLYVVIALMHEVFPESP